MLIRGGRVYNWIVRPDGDPIWNSQDWERAKTLEARWTALGISEQERRQLLLCAVWKAKFPGLTYNPLIESKLRALAP